MRGVEAPGAMGAMGKMSGRGWGIRGSGRLGGLISSYGGKEHLQNGGSGWCKCGEGRSLVYMGPVWGPMIAGLPR